MDELYSSYNVNSIFQEAEVEAINNIKRKAVVHNKRALIKLTTETNDLKETISKIAEHSNNKDAQNEVLVTLTRA